MSEEHENPVDSVAIPRWFLEQTLRHIHEVEELQVMLAYFRLAGGSKSAEPVEVTVLSRDPVLNDALRYDGAPRYPVERIQRGIELAVARGSLIQFTIASTETEVQSLWLMLATPENRIRLERLRAGELTLPGEHETGSARVRVEQVRPGVFQLYEQNIGLVTPIIADRLVEAIELYPQSWIEDAIAAAVSYNRRNWRYIQRILETWATEGRSNETDRRHQPSSAAFDPERHLRGEYAAIFRRPRRE